MKSKKQPYLTSVQLAEALEESQKLGYPTEHVCNYFRLIATHLLGDSRYRKYSKQMHEDMISAALLKCIKNIKNFKAAYSSKCFNYFTRCTEHAFWEVLGKHYKQLNIQRELSLRYAEQLDNIDPHTAQLIRNKQIEIMKGNKDEQ